MFLGFHRFHDHVVAPGRRRDAVQPGQLLDQGSVSLRNLHLLARRSSLPRRKSLAPSDDRPVGVLRRPPRCLVPGLVVLLSHVRPVARRLARTMHGSPYAQSLREALAPRPNPASHLRWADFGSGRSWQICLDLLHHFAGSGPEARFKPRRALRSSRAAIPSGSARDRAER
jgi:hypothetical protein